MSISRYARISQHRKCHKHISIVNKNYKWALESESIEELTNGGNGCDDLAKLELVENGGLTSSIETDHQNSHFFLGKKPAEQFRECQPHFWSWLWIPTHFLHSDLTYRNINNHHQSQFGIDKLSSCKSKLINPIINIYF